MPEPAVKPKDPSNRYANELDHSVNAAGVCWMLLLMAALVFGVNAYAIAKSPASERTYDGMIVAKKWDLASAGIAADGIAIIGDSSGNFAVSTDVLEEELGVQARNYCTYGRFQVTGSAWFLDQAIEASGSAPSLVIVVTGSRTFLLDPTGFEFAQVPIGVTEMGSRVPGVGLGVLRTLQFAAARALPLFAQHRSFERSLLNGAWQIRADVLPVGPGGTTRLPRAYPDGVGPFAAAMLKEMAAVEGPVPSLREQEAIQALVRDAEERGYDLVFVDGPIWDGLVDSPEHMAFLGKIHASIDAACADSERAIRLDVPLQAFPATELENPFHIVPAASARFSKELARQLLDRSLPRGPR